ncbi:MAG: hypothetical protein AB8H79_13870 [Myxococcota bacterium]
MLWLWLLSAPSVAGGGPWTLNPGEHNVYVGFDYFRYSSFRGAQGAAQPTASPLSASVVTGVWTIGMAKDLEVELRLPFESVHVRDSGAEGCVSPDVPEDFCKATANIGDVAGVVKWRAVDELYSSPVSISFSGAFRSGEAYSGARGRLTTLGDGNTDVGVGASVGRTSGAGKGWYTSSAELWYFYRFSNAGSGRDKIPGDELAFSAEALWAFHPRVAIGPAAFGFTRLSGTDFEDIELGSLNGFSSLRATQVKVGGKLALFSTHKGPTVVVTAVGTLYAKNNPSDTLVLGFGLGWFHKAKEGKAF